MGNSDCCCQNTQELNIFSKLYDLFKQMIIDLKDNDKDIKNDIYLIKVKQFQILLNQLKNQKFWIF